MVLLSSFAAFTLLNYITLKYVDANLVQKGFINVCCVSIGAMLCPIFGWLADGYIGRYRLIKGSLVVMCVGAMLWSVVNTVKVFHSDIFAMDASVTILLCLALGIFQVSIIQFSIDQLLDASSEQIMSFIVWYVWTYVSSKAIVQLMVCTFQYADQIPMCLYVAVLFSLSVSADILCNHWLNKEPVTPNPLKLIFKVLCYAVKNKYPRSRSSFQFWDNRHVSRIDFAKMKHGGLFTTREVEDVKAFLHVIGLIFVSCLFLAVSFFLGYEVLSKYQGQHSVFCAMKWAIGDCLKTMLVTRAGYLLVLFLVPLHELVLLPVLRKKLKRLRIFTRFSIGGILLTLHIIGLLSVEAVREFGPGSNFAREMNFTCAGYISGSLPKWCDSPRGDSYYWMTLLSSVQVLGQYLCMTAGLEFVCAQAPYSMKGIIFGFVYTFLGLSLALLELVFLPFHRTVISVSGEVVGCVFWFLLVCMLCTLVLGVILAVVSRCYKNRERDEDPDDITS